MDWTTWNRHLYAAWAPFYDILVTVLEDKRRQALKLANIQPDENVLIMGAGTGLDLNYMPKELRPTAIDICPAMIKRLQKRADRLGIDVDAKIMDGQKLDFDDNTFDVVLLHFVLAVIPDPKKALQEAIRVTRPGGRLVILNKFLHDERKPSLALRGANAIARVLATDITFKLRPILQTPGLKAQHVEQLGLGGFFKIAILEKTTEADATTTADAAPLQPAQEAAALEPAEPEASSAQGEPAFSAM